MTAKGSFPFSFTKFPFRFSLSWLCQSTSTYFIWISYQLPHDNAEVFLFWGISQVLVAFSHLISLFFFVTFSHLISLLSLHSSCMDHNHLLSVTKKFASVFHFNINFFLIYHTTLLSLSACTKDTVVSSARFYLAITLVFQEKKLWNFMWM